MKENGPTTPPEAHLHVPHNVTIITSKAIQLKAIY
jgi:hypothetical protein